MRGVAYAGVLKELAATYGLDFFSRSRCIRHCIGTSIGALFAALVVAGVMPSELEAQVMSRDLASVVAVGDVSQLVTVFKSWGLASSAALEDWVDGALAQKLGKRGLTMADLYEATSVKLTVVVTNITDNCAEYWSHETHPDKRVCEAVVTSMALPPVFPPRTIKRVVRSAAGLPCRQLSTLPLRVGDTVRTPDGMYGVVSAVDGDRADLQVIEDVLYVDGGIRDNFAIAHAEVPPEQVLGLKVTWNCARDIRTLDKYCARLAYCALSVAEEAATRSLDPRLKARICSCDVGDISTVDFNLGPSVVSELLFRGFRAARAFAAPQVTYCDASTQTADHPEAAPTGPT